MISLLFKYFFASFGPQTHILQAPNFRSNTSYRFLPSSRIVSFPTTPIVGLSEVIVDIVETGTTLKENGLEVLEEVCPLSARMVVNQVSQKMEQERISKIIVALKKILDEKE